MLCISYDDCLSNTINFTYLTYIKVRYWLSDNDLSNVFVHDENMDVSVISAML
jgi:hypothetical protein